MGRLDLCDCIGVDMLDLKALGYTVLIIIVLVAGLIWIAVKYGKQQAYKKMEKESEELMKKVLKNTQDAEQMINAAKKAMSDKDYQKWLDDQI